GAAGAHRADPGGGAVGPGAAHLAARRAGRRPGALRRHRCRPRRRRLRPHRRAGRRPGGHRPAQRGRQGRRPPAPRRRPPGHRPRAVGQRPGRLRDRPEGVGAGLQRRRGRQRPVGPRGGGGPPGRHDPRRVRALRPRWHHRQRVQPGGSLMGWREQLTGWRPSGWVSLRPNGVGLQKPRHYRDMAKVAWRNRAHPKYALDVLTKGVCDGCALGVAGLHDWTMDGVHLCTTRLELLELNTADAFDPIVLEDVDALRGRSSSDLRRLGRLGYPMRRRRGEQGFRRISWDEAIDAVVGALRTTDPERVALYLTSRGLTNETYYVAGKAARALGIANVDSAARVCHAPSTVGLKETIGVAASTCSLRDVLETDLVVLWGANPANNQPVLMKHLYLAKKRGVRVAVVNPY